MQSVRWHHCTGLWESNKSKGNKWWTNPLPVYVQNKERFAKNKSQIDVKGDENKNETLLQPCINREQEKNWCYFEEWTRKRLKILLYPKSKWSFAIAFKRNSRVEEGCKTNVISWNEGKKMEVITIKVKANLKQLNIFKWGRAVIFIPELRRN